MKVEKVIEIREALQQLDDVTKVQGLSVFALVMPHGKRGLMNVQILSKGEDTQLAHKLYECMRYSEQLPFDLRNIIMTNPHKVAFKHPAIFPEALAADHIKSWSNEGDVVLEPFCGSGTTVKVARALHRHYIGFEISAEYCEIIRQRMEQTKSLFDL